MCSCFAVHLIEYSIESSNLNLLAWCSVFNNNISVIDAESKEYYANFAGTQLQHKDSIYFNLLYQMNTTYIYQGYLGWTHVKEISNTGLLVSLHHSYNKAANMEIYAISQKGKTRKIYSFEEVVGGILRLHIHRFFVLKAKLISCVFSIC